MVDSARMVSIHSTAAVPLVIQGSSAVKKLTSAVSCHARMRANATIELVDIFANVHLVTQALIANLM